LPGSRATDGRAPVPFAFYLALVMAVGPLVHYALSALGPLLVAELDLSATAFGTLWFVTFGCAGSFTVAGGKLTDVFGPRYLLTGVFGTALLAVVVAAGASTYWWLLLAAALSGLAQSVSNPATNALISAEVAAARQGLVLGIKQSGVQASQFATGLALPSLALLLGWRVALLACGLVGLVGLVLTLRTVPQRPRAPKGASRGERARLSGTVRWMTFYAFVMGAVTQATNVYLPLYAHQELGASVTRAGLVVAVLGGVGIVARLVWGSLASESGGVHGPLLCLAVLAALAMTAFYFARSTGEWLMWVGAGLFSFSALAANVLIMLALVRTVSREAVGRATGWTSLGLYAGFMVGPVSFGRIVDVASFGAAWLAACAVAACLIGTTLVWWRQEAKHVDPHNLQGAA
jgi:predicted MFS family arabinose efflux permease